MKSSMVHAYSFQMLSTVYMFELQLHTRIDACFNGVSF